MATVYLDETKRRSTSVQLCGLATPRLDYTAGKSFIVVGIASDGAKTK